MQLKKQHISSIFKRKKQTWKARSSIYHNSPEEYSEGFYITQTVPSPPIQPGEDSSSMPVGRHVLLPSPAQHNFLPLAYTTLMCYDEKWWRHTFLSATLLQRLWCPQQGKTGKWSKSRSIGVFTQVSTLLYQITYEVFQVLKKKNKKKHTIWKKMLNSRHLSLTINLEQSGKKKKLETLKITWHTYCSP